MNEYTDLLLNNEQRVMMHIVKIVMVKDSTLEQQQNLLLYNTKENYKSNMTRLIVRILFGIFII